MYAFKSTRGDKNKEKNTKEIRRMCKQIGRRDRDGINEI